MPYFDDNGKGINPDLYPKPQLCLSCDKNEDVNEEIACNLLRFDQRENKEFKCFAYVSINKFK